MRIGHILHLSGMNRDTYNSLARRGHLAFMAYRVGDDKRGLTPGHALAVYAFQELRGIGLEASAASLAVNDSWGDILAVAGVSQEPVRANLCGVRRNDIGVIDTWGCPHPKSKGGKPISSATTDLLQLWEIMQPGLASLENLDAADASDILEA